MLLFLDFLLVCYFFLSTKPAPSTMDVAVWEALNQYAASASHAVRAAARAWDCGDNGVGASALVPLPPPPDTAAWVPTETRVCPVAPPCTYVFDAHLQRWQLHNAASQQTMVPPPAPTASYVPGCVSSTPTANVVWQLLQGRQCSAGTLTLTTIQQAGGAWWAVADHNAILVAAFGDTMVESAFTEWAIASAGVCRLIAQLAGVLLYSEEEAATMDVAACFARAHALVCGHIQESPAARQCHAVIVNILTHALAAVEEEVRAAAEPSGAAAASAARAWTPSLTIVCAAVTQGCMSLCGAATPPAATTTTTQRDTRHDDSACCWCVLAAPPDTANPLLLARASHQARWTAAVTTCLVGCVGAVAWNPPQSVSSLVTLQGRAADATRGPHTVPWRTSPPAVASDNSGIVCVMHPLYVDGELWRDVAAVPLLQWLAWSTFTSQRSDVAASIWCVPPCAPATEGSRAWRAWQAGAALAVALHGWVRVEGDSTQQEAAWFVQALQAGRAAPVAAATRGDEAQSVPLRVDVFCANAPAPARTLLRNVTWLYRAAWPTPACAWTAWRTLCALMQGKEFTPVIPPFMPAVVESSEDGLQMQTQAAVPVQPVSLQRRTVPPRLTQLPLPDLLAAFDAVQPPCASVRVTPQRTTVDTCVGIQGGGVHNNTNHSHPLSPPKTQEPREPQQPRPPRRGRPRAVSHPTIHVAAPMELEVRLPATHVDAVVGAAGGHSPRRLRARSTSTTWTRRGGGGAKRGARKSGRGNGRGAVPTGGGGVVAAVTDAAESTAEPASAVSSTTSAVTATPSMITLTNVERSLPAETPMEMWLPPAARASWLTSSAEN